MVGLNPLSSSRLSVWSLHVLLILAWGSLRCSGVLLQSKHMHVAGGSKLTASVNVCLPLSVRTVTGDLSRIPTAWLVSSPWAHFDQRLETETNNSLSSYNLSFKGISLWTLGRSTSHLTLKDKSVCWLWNNLPEEIWFTSLASFISPKSHVYYILWIQESKILGLRFKD